jgi:hypothetical protein
MIIVIPFFWLALCIVVGLIGRGFNIGFWGAFLLSFFFSPLLGFIITLITGTKRPVVVRNTSTMSTQVNVNVQGQWNPQMGLDQLRAEASRRYTMGDYAGCEAITHQMLSMNNSNPQVWYMLATVQSLLRKKDAAFNSLAQATLLGYPSTSTFETAPQLEWLRMQPEWPTFKLSEYRTVVTLSQQGPVASSKDRWMEELEMLSQMKFRGDISEDEYESRKARIRSGLDS